PSRPRPIGAVMPAPSILVGTSARAGMKRPRRRPAIIASPIQTGSHLSNVDNCRLAAAAGAGVFVLVVFGGAGIVLLSLLVSSGYAVSSWAKCRGLSRRASRPRPRA